MSEHKIVTQHELVISSQSLLNMDGSAMFLVNAARMSLKDLTTRAGNLGAKLLYEPLRPQISQARRDVDEAKASNARLQDVAYLAEPARSEYKPSEFFTSRFLFQLMYTLIEEGRFTESSMDGLASTESKLAVAHRQISFPTRVHEDMKPQGFNKNSVSDARLRRKIYNQDQMRVIGHRLENTKSMRDVKARSAQIVRAVSFDMQKYDVSGIELSLLSVCTLLQGNPELLVQVMSDLLDASNSKFPHNALVQAVSVQPARVDLYGNLPYVAMKSALDVVQEKNFQGTVIYAPGAGDAETEVKDLRSTLFPQVV